jgi:hypothetical protein
LDECYMGVYHAILSVLGMFEIFYNKMLKIFYYYFGQQQYKYFHSLPSS